MFRVHEMTTHRIKVRKYLTYCRNGHEIKALKVFRNFNKKDRKELERLYSKTGKMNKLFLQK